MPALSSSDFKGQRIGGFYCDLFGHRVYKDACVGCSLGPRDKCNRWHKEED